MYFLIFLGFTIIFISIIWFLIEVIKKIVKRPSKISYSIMLFIAGWILALGGVSSSIGGWIFFIVVGFFLEFCVYIISDIKNKRDKNKKDRSTTSEQSDVSEPYNNLNLKPYKSSSKAVNEIINTDETDEVIPNSVLKARIVNSSQSKSLGIPKYQQFLSEHNVEVEDVSKKKHKDYVIFDLETTGLNYEVDEIIQVAALKIKNDQIVDQFNSYVKPKNSISDYITNITGITNTTVADSDSIEQVITQLSDFVGNDILIGHNIVQFDIPFIVNNGFSRNKIRFVDTLRMVKQMQNDFQVKLKNMKLQTLKEYFGLNFSSHDGLEDCKTNFVVYKKLRDHDLEYKVQICQEPNSELKGLTFVLTGVFTKTKNEIKTEIENHGGRVTGTVSGKTDYLIDGEQKSKNLSDGKHSASELKAHEIQKAKGKIRIIAYPQLEKLIESRKPKRDL